MLFRQTIADAREDIARHTEHLAAKLDQTSEVVAAAILLIGALATLAIVLTLATRPGPG